MIYKELTNLYSLSKTLRFELKPVGRTRENIDNNLGFDKELQTFLIDQKIEDAYQTLKPVFDKLHEKFITESLESEEAKRLSFAKFFEEYNTKTDSKDKDKEKKLEVISKSLREEFGNLYTNTAKNWKAVTGSKTKFKKNNFEILTESAILKYLEDNLEEIIEIKSPVEILKIKKAIEEFNKGFFSYLGGFNTNRKNYYDTSKEASTAISTRIIHDNLPKFCDNISIFQAKQNEYLNCYNQLNKAGKNITGKSHPIIEHIFDISSFSHCLSQTEIEKYNEEIANANYLVNLYNQEYAKNKDFKKLSTFKKLYKQIGCGEKTTMILTITDSGGNGTQTIQQILEHFAKAGEDNFSEKSELSKMLTLLKNRPNFLGIYLSKKALNTISNKYFQNWYHICEILAKSGAMKQEKKSEGEDFKLPGGDSIELEQLLNALNNVAEANPQDWQTTIFKNSVLDNTTYKEILFEADKPSTALVNILISDLENLKKQFLEGINKIKNINDHKTPENIKTIKSWLDSGLAITQILKYFIVNETKIKGEKIDPELSNILKEILDSDAKWYQWYDAIRNYLTKKPQDDLKANKLKLNFENSTLAAGWDKNKEPDNWCSIFIDESKNKHYLAVIANTKQKGFNKIFENTISNPLFNNSHKESWSKVEYKLLPGPNKMLPKCLLPKSNRMKFGANHEILNIYDSGSFKKNEKGFNPNNLNKIIEFYKSAIQKYEDWLCFDFNFQNTNNYQDISQFYNDVAIQGYKLSSKPINQDYLFELVNDGKVYLFEIHNQDFNNNKSANHKKNLHTIYWQALFEDVINKPKLNGEAEIFYRKAITPDKLEYNEKDKYKGKKVIKNYRFSKEKFYFHVPITLNFCLSNNKVNDEVNTLLKSTNQPITYLGLDRGEKHLVYYSLVDQNGKIIDQGSFNEIDQNNKKVNYEEKLAEKQKNRDEARKNWQTIGEIKNIKEGYISALVRQIADLAIKHNALIVMEDLNTGFKRGRQRIEKSIYQKFELALAKKLNFLVDKNAEIGEPSSVTKALQLTPPVNNYGDIEKKKQVGIILYTRANYTSQTDPVTGWRKSIYISKSNDETTKQKISEAFTDIGYENGDYYFEYKDKNNKIWKLYSGKNGQSLDRFIGKRKEHGEWETIKINLNKDLNKLFQNFDKSKSLYNQILDGEASLTKINDKDSPWESLRKVINLIQQIRNTGTSKNEDDYLQTPVRDKQGHHFDSRLVNNNNLPTCGDANGAFNIARKGIMMFDRIKNGEKNLFIRDEEWDQWLAN